MSDERVVGAARPAMTPPVEEEPDTLNLEGNQFQILSPEGDVLGEVDLIAQTDAELMEWATKMEFIVLSRQGDWREGDKADD